jgi:hypothetical protein
MRSHNPYHGGFGPSDPRSRTWTLEQEMRQRSTALVSREQELQKQSQLLTTQEKALLSQAADVEKTVQERLSEESAALVAAGAKKVEVQFQAKLDAAREEQQAQSARIVELETKELEFRKQRASLAEERRQLELTVARQIDVERDQIRNQAAWDEQTRNQAVLAAKDKSLAELNAKLAESQHAELEVRKQREALEAEKNELELTVMRRLDGERQRIRELTQREADERNRLKLAEKDKVIGDMRKQVEELRRKSEQGSEQLAGEVQEMALEATLRSHFPRDEFQPVAVGRAGGDLIQKVIGPGGTLCGTILWESKRTKSWQDAWLAKMRDDQRRANADLAVIATAALPKALTSFDRMEDVWVSAFGCIVPLAKALRLSLIQSSILKAAGQDRNGKTDRMFNYITGHDFKQRVAAIVEAYVALRAALEREKRSVTASWAKREKSLDLVLIGTAGLYGDLNGIVGNSMPEIEGLEPHQLEEPRGLSLIFPGNAGNAESGRDSIGA